MFPVNPKFREISKGILRYCEFLTQLYTCNDIAFCVSSELYFEYIIINNLFQVVKIEKCSFIQNTQP